MKKAILILTGLTMLPVMALAGGNAKVNWSNPENYKDVIASDGSQEEFVARTLKELEATISELAESLPDGQTLEMNVTDLDLAGDVKMSGARTQHQDIRVVKDSYPARMKFQYRLLDGSGKVLKEGEEKLQSRTLSASMRTGSSESLEMEKRMIRGWFKRSIAK